HGLHPCGLGHRTRAHPLPNGSRQCRLAKRRLVRQNLSPILPLTADHSAPFSRRCGRLGPRIRPHSRWRVPELPGQPAPRRFFPGLQIHDPLRLLHLRTRLHSGTQTRNHARCVPWLRSYSGREEGVDSAYMATNTYDALIVGSGITGGWAAKELTEKGLNVLVLEAGRTIIPEEDYVEHVPLWELKYRRWDDRAERQRTQFVQRECDYDCDEFSHKFFVNDLENPYTVAPGKPFTWIRGRQVGGRSITWGRQTYRWSDLDFEANLRENIAVDWPIRYADLAPWYDYVEEFAGVSGQPEGLPQLPDSKFLPPMEMTCVELDFRAALAKYYGDRICTIGRCAILTQTHKGRAACHYCGECQRGCITQSYFSSLNSTLPAAKKTGRLTIRPYSVVHSLA